MTDDSYDAIDAVLDTAAETLHEIENDWDQRKQIIQAEARQAQTDFDALLAPLKERIARLEGQMAVLLGGDSTNGAARSKRKAPINGHRLLEHRPQ